MNYRTLHTFIVPALIVVLLVPLLSCSKKSDLGKGVNKHDILFGTAVNPRKFRDDKYYNTLAENFNAVTPENVMKWETIHPERDDYDFRKGDEIVEFAQKHNMKVRGHTLVWHNQNPIWLNSEVWTREELMAVLEDHIKTVVGHYKGKVYAWDVVNEPLDGSEYRTTIWEHYIGPEYIEYAFRWAHEADPDALLYLNDYSNGEINDKSTKMYEMVKDLLEKGVPIHGVGLQLHLTTQYSFDFESLYMNINRFTKLGLKVDFTEVDIRLKEPIEESDFREQARWYAKLMEIVLAVPDCDTFVIWGLSDAHSWVPQFYSGYDSALIFDKEMDPKPAYYALVDTLKEGPRKLPYSTNYKDKFKNRRTIPPFRAYAVETPPSIDGNPDDPQWETGITYPFSYNQLESMDLRPPDKDDLWGEWTIVYRGNTLYGLMRRHDDITHTSNSFDYENDNLEVFFRLNDVFAQLRSIVGEDWRPHDYPGERSIAWNSDGTVCEFSVEMPDKDLTGLIAGWNIALSDNDGKDVRDHQLYPVNGQNAGWQGKELATIQFVGDSPRVPEKPRSVVPFKALEAPGEEPAIDGKYSAEEWEGAVYYPLSYDHHNRKEQSLGAETDDIHADWGLLLKENMLYGFLLRKDNTTVTENKEPVQNDMVEIFFEGDNGTPHIFQTHVGDGFQENPFSGDHKATWSQNGSVLEFKIELPEELSSANIIGFNISLHDVDSDGLSHVLFPIPAGEDENPSLAELQILN
ncbi:MAG: endo-1,4-beta-xylanase [Spirochaetota bacterium]